MDNITTIQMNRDNDRIDYIDAMRGLAMFMVVVFHIFTFCELTNPINLFINHQFQLPLFFFISGFFISRSCSKPLLQSIGDKLQRLVIPTIIVMSLYVWAINTNYYSAITNNFKSGYWFTYVLFGFILIYIMIDKLTYFVKNKIWHDAVILISAVFVILLVSFLARHSQSHTIMNIFSIYQYQYYIYFVLGSICFQYKDHIFNLMNSRLTFGLLMIGFIIGKTGADWDSAPEQTGTLLMLQS